MKIKKAEFLKSARQKGDMPPGRYPEVALAGRSNVGKSSLLNTLANNRNLARTSGTPGKTRALYFYLFNDRLCLVDLPGYGYARVSKALQKEWAVLVEGYLNNRDNLAAIIHIVDMRHEPSDGDRQMAAWLRHFNLPGLVVATKADKVPRGKRKQGKEVIARALEVKPEEVIVFSARTREGRDDILKALQKIAPLE